MKAISLALLFSVMLLVAPATFGGQQVSADNLVLLPVENDPTVSFIVWFKAGSQNDPPGKAGLAALTGSMLAEASTQKNSYEDILEKLYPLAASYDAITSVEMTVIRGRVHKDNLKEYYPLLMDAILLPAFKQEDLDRLKSQTLNYLENMLRYASDEELGKAVLYNSVFAGTPYGHITAGLINDVRGITLDDVRKFYGQHYRRGNVTIGLGGGYDATLVDRIRSDVGGLPAGTPKPVAKPRVRLTKGLQFTIVEKDAPATAISMGMPINVLRGTKDWYALALANSWLGEHRNSSSHLYQVIREERGLNYGDYSYIEYFPGAGGRRVPPQNVARRQQILEIWIRPVPNETRHFTLRAAVREFKRVVDYGMTGDQFELTKNFLSKYVLNYAPSTIERLGYAVDDKFYGIKGSHLEMFREMMSTLTLKDVNAAVKKYWRYGDMKVAIVTKDAQSLKDALVADSPSPITYTSPKPESVLAEDKEISTFPLKVKASNVKIVPVTELLVK